MTIMNLGETERKILNIIAEKSHRSTSTDVFDTAVIRLTPEEVYNILNQLASLGLIEIALGGRKPAGADFRIINMTKAGLDVTSENQLFR